MTRSRKAVRPPSYSVGEEIHAGFLRLWVLVVHYNAFLNRRQYVCTDGHDRVYVFDGMGVRKLSWEWLDYRFPGWRPTYEQAIEERRAQMGH